MIGSRDFDGKRPVGIMLMSALIFVLQTDPHATTELLEFALEFLEGATREMDKHQSTAVLDKPPQLFESVVAWHLMVVILKVQDNSVVVR